MSKPKRHHYIPQMLSRRFADSGGILHVFDNRFPQKGIQKRTPKNLFVERDFYTQVDAKGTKDVSVETEFLARLESEASLVIENTVSDGRRGNFPNLSPDEREVLQTFFVTQFSRVPDTLDSATDEVRQMMPSSTYFAWQLRPLNGSGLSAQNSSETIERHLMNARIKHLQMPRSPEMSELLAKMGIVVAVIEELKPERSFIIGSSPVVQLSHPERSHLSNSIVEVWLPLARDVALFPSPWERDKVIFANDKHIRAINTNVFQQSTVIAGWSREIIESVLGEGESNGPDST